MNKNSKKVLNDSKAKLDEPVTPIPSLLKTQRYDMKAAQQKKSKKTSKNY